MLMVSLMSVRMTAISMASLMSELPDCNNNGQLDVCDIESEQSNDLNQDSIPDECQCIADVITNGAVIVL